MKQMPKTGKTQRQPEMVSGVGYCRKCQKTMDLSKFYPTTNLFLDSNGYLSICKECSNNIYDHYFSIYGNMEQALQLTCQDLDVRFSKETVKQVQSQVDKLLSQGKKASAIFGFYKSKLGSTGKNNEGLDSFRYKDSDFVDKKELATFNPINNDDEDEIDEDLEIFWGKGFAIDDLIFLESELTNWKKTHKCDNQAEITLLKEICIKILIIRNKRALGENTSSDLKELQDLMKTASVDPAKANAASAGKSLDSFGIWVKDIEQLRPAEWYEQQEKYKDMDGFVPYIKNYIVRPIENFLTGVRNFVVNDNIDADLDSADIGISDGDTNG
jgi:hypothetical protein